jgi:aspartyl-tRNA(Asn)/glutamyl-tRNA(Gln) amidotransferase subunit A
MTAATMTDLHWLSAGELAEMIRSRELSPVELTRALLDRIERHDGDLDSFISLDPKALEKAQAAEDQVMSGADLGPLHGVPFALKDIIDVKGLGMTCHSAILQENIADSDAEVTSRLLRAGGILLGKLATHEFALGGPAFDLPFPPARNPWNREMFPGGSSSGAGAAVAAGFVPAAIGTDTGGSVRNPASCCGLAGMKATYETVSRRGVFPLSYSLDNVGPLTRTVADNALLLNVLAGADFTGKFNAGVAGMRVGVIRHFHERDLVADEQVTDGIDAALAVLAGLGAEIVDIDTAPLQDYAACNRVILLSEACAIHAEWLRERPQDYSAVTRERLMPGLFLSSKDYVQANRWRRILADDFNEVMQSVDVAVAASSMDPTFAIDDAEAVARFYPRQARTPFNVTGHPALSVPVGFDTNRLPLSMQIVGRYQDEATVYRAALAYEQATNWHNEHPALDAA